MPTAVDAAALPAAAAACAANRAAADPQADTTVPARSLKSSNCCVPQSFKDVINFV